MCPFCATRRAAAIAITIALVGCGAAPATSSEATPTRDANQQGRAQVDETPAEETAPVDDTTEPVHEEPDGAPVAAYGGAPMPESPRDPAPRE